MGPRIVVLEDGVLAHLTKIRYIRFINVPTTSQVTRHDDKGSSAVATDTCPFHNTAVVVRPQGSKRLSPLPNSDATVDLPQTKHGFIREKDEQPLVPIPSACAKLAPRALTELGLSSRSSGLKLQGSNSIPDCLHRDGTWTWSSLLSQHSLKTGTIHKPSPCYSDRNGSDFTLGRAFRSSGSRSVGNGPRCSMTLAKSENFAAMTNELVSNILFVNCRL